MSEVKKTPFFECHKKANARMVEFAGYWMPIQYHSIQKEHLKVRRSVGIFDLSHMGEFFVRGSGALNFLQKVTTNDVAALQMGRVQYGALCYPEGGIVDDLLIYRLENEYMLVVNASNIDKDFAWLQEHKPKDVELINSSDEIGLLAIQGPKAETVMSKLTDFNLSILTYYESARAKILGRETLFSRTGYTGEDGFEIYCTPAMAEVLWEKSLQAGKEFDVEPIGLGARDSLRLEMKYMLYGNDIDKTTNPIEAGLSWICNLEKGDFIGRQPIAEMKERKPSRVLRPMILKEKAIPRKDYSILHGDKTIGRVTSGAFSPVLEEGIALGYVPREDSNVGNTVEIDIRGKRVPAEIIKGAFYRSPTHK